MYASNNQYQVAGSSYIDYTSPDTPFVFDLLPNFCPEWPAQQNVPPYLDQPGLSPTNTLSSSSNYSGTSSNASPDSFPNGAIVDNSSGTSVSGSSDSGRSRKSLKRPDKQLRVEIPEVVFNRRPAQPTGPVVPPPSERVISAHKQKGKKPMIQVPHNPQK
jgi:hypothetical protein